MPTKSHRSVGDTVPLIVTSLIISTSLLHVVNYFSKIVDNLEQAMRTQRLDGLFADLLQVVRFLRVDKASISLPGASNNEIKQVNS